MSRILKPLPAKPAFDGDLKGGERFEVIFVLFFYYLLWVDNPDSADIILGY